MSITVLSNPVLDDATSVLLYRGLPNVMVSWTVESGPGTVASLSGEATDSRGLAMALYSPNGGGAATAVVRVTHGT